ncbi:hypothetical protein [Pasteurella multocida]|uniref:hypothetical protein n=2 Tax=Pasteurella multocida TaxID=747 RepID=UPI00397D614D
MGFFSNLFKTTKSSITPAKQNKMLSYAEEQLELQIQQYESETDLIYKKIKAPSGKVYKVDVRVETPDQKVYIDRQGMKDCEEFELPDWYERKTSKRLKALILMFYTPESGVTEHRAVEIRCFDIEQNLFYGFCFLREMYLTFRFDRIGEIVDLNNGNQAINNLKQFLIEKVELKKKK